MNCPLLTEEFQILVDYCAERLEVAEMRAFRAHLDSCPNCQSECAAQQRVWTALDLWEPEPISLGFSSELLTRIETVPQPWSWARLWQDVHHRLGSAAPWAAAGATALLAFVISSGPALGPIPRLAQGSRIERVDVDQVERTLDDLSLLRQLESSADPVKRSRPL